MRDLVVDTSRYSHLHLNTSTCFFSTIKNVFSCTARELTYRDVRLSLCAVESELQGLIPVEKGKETLGPKRGNEIS